MIGLIVLLLGLCAIILWAVLTWLCINIINNRGEPDYLLLLSLIPVFHLIYVIIYRKSIKFSKEEEDEREEKQDTGGHGGYPSPMPNSGRWGRNHRHPDEDSDCRECSEE